ncbi:hypothetical protein KORDIASMS9_04482 [Kordia sp. SMS9]|uniref:hypothetical protein n=1 Tax=Kordia sp. SMS9 TaxID=2282170 RepID=UPI000E1001FA|nr:hypothetical protein [Kordia sp. SMS9]AXG72214.1 hypothetical protein KORDIASMS9_04482 [Kordia sp. SMS9]
MKKRDLNSLKLNKSIISSLKGGLHSIPIDSDCTSLGDGTPCPDTKRDCGTQS